MLTELIPPQFAGAPVAEFAAHLRLSTGFADNADEAAALDLYLRGATAAIEAVTGKALITRRLEWTVTRWRDGGRQTVPLSRVQSVVSFKLVSATGTETVVNPGAYTLVPEANGHVLAGRSGALPTIPDLGRAVIELEAGYGDDWNAVPADLRQAVLLLGAHFYENRHLDLGRDGGLPVGVLSLLAPYRPVRL